VTDPLAHLAGRVKDDPFFLASVLARYAGSERLDDAGLADALGCPAELLPRLRLCRPPRPEPEHFWADVTQIAGRFDLDPDRLAQVIRRGQAIQQMQSQVAAAGPGTLLAARDAPPPEPPEGPP
jgi:hypothetical protein